ncbi:hypothetical protein ACLOJK_037589 [Asimina triloba]
MASCPSSFPPSPSLCSPVETGSLPRHLSALPDGRRDALQVPLPCHLSTPHSRRRDPLRSLPHHLSAMPSIEIPPSPIA